MNVRDFLLRVRALLAPRQVERELDEELAFHIERETQKHVAQDMSPADARIRAQARFGSVPLAADQCRDARGTAFFDGLAQDIRYALTTFRRAPLVALTIVATVALGLGLVAVVFTCFDAFFLRADAVRNPSELFEVRRPPSPGVTGAWVALTHSDYDALLRNTSVFTDTVAILSGVETRVGGQPISGTLVTGNFFQVLGVGAALGRTLMPIDDERLAGRPVIVLSHRGWTKLFASDPAAVGQHLMINGAPYEIVGVMPPGFRGLATFSPDYWAPLDRLSQFRQDLSGKEDHVALDVVGRLKPGMSVGTATAALTTWADGNPDMKPMAGGRKTILLRPRLGTASPDLRQGLLQFAPLFFAFGLILMIGCANVANLLLARGVARQREIGTRLSLGASRGRIIRQLLTESLLLALAASACGLGVSRLLLEMGAYAASLTVPPDIAEQVSLSALGVDWRVAVFLVCGALVSTVFFGLAPALQATRLELVRTMRGEVTRDTRPRRARHALIALQVSAAAMLLICAAVFLRSALVAASVKPGMRTTDTALLEMPNEPLRHVMLQAVAADPSVAAVAASWPQGIRGELAEASVSPEGKPAETSATFGVGFKFVSPEYFALFDIDVLRGRTFTRAERSPEAGVVVVSESTARRLWPGRDAVGQVVRLEGSQRPNILRLDSGTSAPQLPFRVFNVVGIVREPRVGIGPFEMVDAGVYVPTSPESAGTSLVLRVRGDPDLARRRLIDRLSKVDPAMGGITTMRTIAGTAVFLLLVAFWTTVVLAGLAIALTLSGLFSVLSYLVEQRTKEIGVRIALGATTRNVARLVLSQSVVPVGVGLMAGGGLAAVVAKMLMSTRAASQIEQVVHVFDPVAYAASLLVIVTACALAASTPAFRAARIDPIAALRND